MAKQEEAMSWTEWYGFLLWNFWWLWLFGTTTVLGGEHPATWQWIAAIPMGLVEVGIAATLGVMFGPIVTVLFNLLAVPAGLVVVSIYLIGKDQYLLGAGIGLVIMVAAVAVRISAVRKESPAMTWNGVLMGFAGIVMVVGGVGLAILA